MELNTLKSTFINNFGKEPTSLFFSPGRINLIGEHIDYNGGFVFPCPITLGTFAPIAAPRPNPIVPRPPDVISVLGCLYV